MIDPSMVSKELMEYFRELSPRDRKLKLDAIKDTEESVISFCRNLYDARYSDTKKGEHSVDNWLWKIVYLSGLFNKKTFFRKAVYREAEAAVKELYLKDAGTYTDMEKTLLYLEFRNAAKRYLSTCDSPDYGTTMFGFKKSDADTKKIRAAEDIWKASRGIALEAGETDRLEIWCLALRDELFQYDVSSKNYYTKLDSDCH